MESPTNNWTTVEAKIAAALPKLAGFQAFAAAADADEAARFVFFDELGESLSGETWSQAELNEARCWAVVSSAPQDGYGFTQTSPFAFSAWGSVEIYFDRLVPPGDAEDSEADAAVLVPGLASRELDRWMKNRIGSILEELANFMANPPEGEDGGVWIRGARVVDGPWQNHADEWETKGRRQGCQVQIDWGFGGQ